MTEDEFRAAHPGLPLYVECGCCGHLHRLDYYGDCRNDAERFTHEEVEARHPPGIIGQDFEILDEQAQLEEYERSEGV